MQGQHAGWPDSESAGRPRCLRIIENIIAERPTSANTSQPTRKFDHKVAYLKLVKSLRRAH
jgi:hypothetical protein